MNVLMNWKIQADHDVKDYVYYPHAWKQGFG